MESATPTHVSTRLGHGLFGTALLLSTSLLILSGCGTNPVGGATLHTRDSLGVQVVENESPRWPPGHGWRIDTIGGGADSAEELSRVRDIVPLSSGGFVLVNEGTSQLRYYDSTGALTRAVGGPGQGLGEFLRCQV